MKNSLTLTCTCFFDICGGLGKHGQIWRFSTMYTVILKTSHSDFPESKCLSCTSQLQVKFLHFKFGLLLKVKSRKIVI